MTELNNLERFVADKVRSLPAPLRDPIVLDGQPLPGPKQKKKQPLAGNDVLEKQFNKEFQKKLALIAKHYGLSLKGKDFGMKLALGLMFDFVPGFQVVGQSNQGRPVRWTEEILATLFCVVELQQLNGGAKSKKEALRRLSNQEPWRELLLVRSYGEARLGTDTLLKNLETQHDRARKLPLAKVFMLQKTKITHFFERGSISEKERKQWITKTLMACLDNLLPRAFPRDQDKQTSVIEILLPK